MDMLLEDVRDSYGLEIAEKVSCVFGILISNVRSRNLFGLSEYLEDLKIDLLAYMIETEFRYSISAYVTCGLQSAVDKSRYYSAQKRKPQFDRGQRMFVDLSELNVGLEDTKCYDDQLEVLVDDISSALGVEIAKEIKDLLQQKDGARFNKLAEALKVKLQEEPYCSWFISYLKGGYK